MADNRVISVARWMVGAVGWLNIVGAVIFVVALALSFVGEAALAARIAAKYRGAVPPGTAIAIMRGLALIGLVAVVAVHAIVRALQSIIATIRADDPFAAGNAAAVRRIGVGLLVIQLCDLGFGIASGWLARLGADTLGWTPSVAGWLSVLLAFVLAQVFASGTALRDDVAGTV